jgi:Protein of unknown function (DUF2000)
MDPHSCLGYSRIDVRREDPLLGYQPEEIVTSEPTRSARYKWAIVVDTTVPAGLMANAVACVAASTGALLTGLIARGGPDASGHDHPGLPWAGCTVLGGPPEEIAAVRARAAASDGVLVADMPRSAQTNRVYDDYLGELAGTKPEDLGVSAFSVFGPRNRVDKLVKKLALL